MLVKGRFLGSARMQGYDGGAAELVHISADGITVVALSMMAQLPDCK
jgi:hypothetical protein